MGFSDKSYGKKSNKGTHTPMLKVFKDMMRRDHSDPEKANLLLSKQNENKKRKYCVNRSKSDQRSYDSSGTDGRRKYKVFMQRKSTQEDSIKQQSGSGKKLDETCSCISCALKHLVSEYMGLGCLVLLLAVSVIFAYLVVIPWMNKHPCGKGPKFAPRKLCESTTVPRAEDGNTEVNSDKDGKNFLGKTLDEIISPNFGGLSALTGLGNEFSENNFRDQMSLSESIDRPVGLLSEVIDSSKLNDDSAGERLKSFYKQLMETEEKIKRIKKANEDYSVITDNRNYENSEAERSKRSVKALDKPKMLPLLKRKRIVDNNKNANFAADSETFRKLNVFFPPFTAFVNSNNGSLLLHKNITSDKKARNKRYGNLTDEPTGFIIENKKIIVEYQTEPAKRKFPKCSHSPVESKSHEKQLKHPFYKNTQRVDEFLDNFLDKNLPEILSDPFNKFLDKDKCKHGKEAKAEEEIINKNRNENVITTKVKDPALYDNFEIKNGHDRDIRNTDSSFARASTIPGNKLTKYYMSELSTNPNSRKLLQIDDPENGNEGSKEIDSFDDTPKKEVSEKSKESPLEVKDTAASVSINWKPNMAKPVPNYLNPNWKGPLPLYPDELNTMVTAVNNKKVAVPNYRDVPSELENSESNSNDMEYIEDHLQNKYDGLVKMAQAYSDYGVLDEKKEYMRNEKDQAPNGKNKDHRIKLTVDDGSFLKNDFYGTKKLSRDLSLQQKQKKWPRQETPGPDDSEYPEAESNYDSSADDKRVSDDHKKQNQNQQTQHNPEIKFNFKPSRSLKLKPTQILPYPYFDSKQLHENSHIKNPEETYSIKEHDTKSAAEDNFSFEKFRRSLKSVEYNTNNITDENYLRKYSINKTHDGKKINQIHNYIDSAQEVNSISSRFFKGLLDKISDNFFSMIEKSPAKNHKSSDDQIKDSDFDITGSDLKNPRSRKLMFFETKHQNVSEDIADVRLRAGRGFEEFDRNSDLNKFENFTSNITTTEEYSLATNTTQLEQLAKESYIKMKNKKEETPTKNVVKRNAPENNNLVFWKDMYDDEYGVTDIPKRELTTVSNIVKTGIKKSQKWINDKLKHIAEICNKPQPKSSNSSCKKIFHRSARHTNYLGADVNPSATIKDQQEQSKEEEPLPDKIKTDFTYLTSNMKNVCQQAAKAVKQTKSLNVHEDKDTTTLMRQLVKLMSDLVDFQVQQKTCLKLPSDLRNFLEWLTSPNNEKTPESGKSIGHPDNDVLDSWLMEQNEYKPTPSVKVEENTGDPKTECLEVIRLVENLIQQYDKMSNEDKKKAIGVREYLEKQLQFLHRQLLTYTNEYDDQEFNRYKRDASYNKPKTKNLNHNSVHKTHKKRRCRHKRKSNRFVKSFGKKHTKSTFGYDDSAQIVTEVNRIVKREGLDVEKSQDIHDGEVNIQDNVVNAQANVANSQNSVQDNTGSVNDNTRTKIKEEVASTEGAFVTGSTKVARNLQDVYYRALENAKKCSTAKHIHKKQDNFGFNERDANRN